MSVNGGGVNTLSSTIYVFFFFKEKLCRMFWNVKICIWKDFKVFRIFPLKILHSESIDMQIEEK